MTAPTRRLLPSMVAKYPLRPRVPVSWLPGAAMVPAAVGLWHLTTSDGTTRLYRTAELHSMRRAAADHLGAGMGGHAMAGAP
jgi:hypothetical protein